MLDLLIKIQENRKIIENAGKDSKNIEAINNLRNIKNKFENHKKIYVTVSNNLKNLKDEIQESGDILEATRKELEKDEAKLYSNTKYDLKFITSMEKSIEAKKREASSMEDKSFELLCREEELSKQKSEKREELVKLRDEFYKCRDIYNNYMAESQQMVQKAKDNLEDMEKLVPEELLEQFNNIFKAKGSGAAEILNGVCQGCRMKVSAITLDYIKKNKKIVYCDNCGRIIHCKDVN
jgi:hypothetical protein